MTYKSTFISLIIIIAFGLAAWTTFLSSQSRNSIKTNNNLPDAFMDDVIATVMDKLGKVKMKIVTPRMVHYAVNDVSKLSLPQLTIYRNSPNPWYVTSKYAQATQGIENVDFWEDVVLHHAADENNPATLIKTPTLTVHPNQKTAETKDFITMVQPSLIVKAIGMFADMNTGDIKLLSQARGEYVPSS